MKCGNGVANNFIMLHLQSDVFQGMYSPSSELQTQAARVGKGRMVRGDQVMVDGQ